MYSSANDIQFYPIGRDIPEDETSKYRKINFMKQIGRRPDMRTDHFICRRVDKRFSNEKRDHSRFFN